MQTIISFRWIYLCDTLKHQNVRVIRKDLRISNQNNPDIVGICEKLHSKIILIENINVFHILIHQRIIAWQWMNISLVKCISKQPLYYYRWTIRGFILGTVSQTLLLLNVLTFAQSLNYPAPVDSKTNRAIFSYSTA